MKRYMKAVLKACVGFHAIKSNYNPNYTVALTLDPASGVLTDTSMFTPDFLNRNPMMFKAKKGSDPDTPSMMEALSGEHRDAFMEAMKNEMSKLEHHGTWKVVRQDTLPNDAKVLPVHGLSESSTFPVDHCARLKLDSVLEEIFKLMLMFMKLMHQWQVGPPFAC